MNRNSNMIMKFVKSVLMILIITTRLCGQDVDLLNIYCIPEITTYIHDLYSDPNYVRVNADYKVHISDKGQIRDLLAAYEAIDRSPVSSSDKSEYNSCRVVVDYIGCGKVLYTVVIDSSNNLSFDEPYSEVIYYKIDEGYFCKIKQLIPLAFPITKNKCD